MDISTLRIEKVLGEVPSILTPNTIYLVNKNGYLEIAMTDMNGNKVLTSAPIITNYNDLINLPDLTTKADKSNIYTVEQIDKIFKDFKDYLVGDAPSTMDTIHELANSFRITGEIVSALSGMTTTKADLVNGKVKLDQLPEYVAGGLTYIGSHDPVNPLPTASTGNKGMYFIMRASTDDWTVGDWAVSNGSSWDRIHHTEVIVDKSLLGLDKINNTSDADKPLSLAVVKSLNNKADLIDGKIDPNQLPVPVPVTKTTLGLEFVDNTADTRKPVSLATQAILDTKADLKDGKVRPDQLPDISKTAVGLDKVDNTTDMEKPISTVTKTALDLKADLVDGKVKVAQLPDISKTAIGLPNVDDTSDANKPVSIATKTALDLKADLKDGKVKIEQLPDISKSAIGLSDVDNTSDLAKPLSTSTIEALTHKADLKDGKVKIEQLPDISKTAIGLSNVDNTSDIDKPVSTATKTILDLKADLIDGKVKIEQLPDISKSAIGLADVDNTSDLAKPLSTLTIDALTHKADLVDGKVNPDQLPVYEPVTKTTLGLEKVNNTADLDKPLSKIAKDTLVYKADLIDGKVDPNQLPDISKTTLGLDRVDNTTDMEKPISTVTKTALDLKADLVDGILKRTQLPTLAKTDIGLDKVDNTTDASKPISSATKVALDKKLDGYLNPANNIYSKLLITNDHGVITTSTINTDQINALRDISGKDGLGSLLLNKANLRDGRLCIEEVPFEIAGGITYVGLWDPNTEVLPEATDSNLGHYYIVTANESISDGYAIGDWAISGVGRVWRKIPNGVNTNVLSHILSKVAFTGDYRDLNHKPILTKTMVFANSLMPFIGNSKWFPERPIKVTGAYVSIGLASSNYVEIDIKKNGTSILGSNTLHLASRAIKTAKIILAVDLTEDDYLTADILHAVDGANLSLTIIYE